MTTHERPATTTLVGTAAAAALLLGAASDARAQEVDIPCRTARLIVPWSPGGETDIIFRTFVEAVNEAGAEPQLQVVNVSGQGGNKGAKEARAADPDGCTLFAMHQSAISSFLTGRVDFTWDAFQPTALLTRTPAIIGANPNVPYDDLEGLADYAAEHPGEVDGGATLGSTSHFSLLLIADDADVDFNYVSYDGTRERMTALLADNIDIGEITLAAAKEYLKSGQLKGLGILAEERNPEIPDVPTAKEQGIDVVMGTERGVMLPEGTPREVVDHYVGLFEQAAQDPEVAEQMKAKGTEVMFMPPEQYAQHLQETFDKWKEIAVETGMYAGG